MKKVQDKKMLTSSLLNTNDTTNGNAAIVYIRVSTKEQAEHGFSKDIQRKQAEIFIKEKGFSILHTYEEDQSASKVIPRKITRNEFNLEDSLNLQNRPDLLEIIRHAEKKEFQHLIVYTRDRLTRDSQQYLALKAYLLAQGVQIHYSRPGEFDRIEDQKLNRILEILLSSYAELESDLISIRVKAGMQSSVKKGTWVSGPRPYGYKEEDDDVRKKPLQAKLPEEQHVQEIFGYYNIYGYGYRKIAKLMNEKYNTDKWCKNSIARIITNETYTGRIVWNRHGGRRNRCKHDEDEHVKSNNIIEDAAIIAREDWKDATYLRGFKYEIKDPYYYNTPFILKDKLICSMCGQLLKGKNYGYDNRVYRCPTLTNSKSEMIISKELLENEVISSLLHVFTSTAIEKFWSIYHEKYLKLVSDNEQAIAAIRLQVDELEEYRSNIRDICLQDIDSEMGYRLKEESILYEKQISRLKGEILHRRSQEKPYFKTKEDFEKALIKLYENFRHLPIDIQRMFIHILVNCVHIHVQDKSLDLKIILNTPNSIFPSS